MIPVSATSTVLPNAADTFGAKNIARDNNARIFSKQNWVLDPLQDTLLIIVAPVLTLVMALAAIYFFGIVKGATLVLISHVVFTVAHHLPTFIRIYGDVDLFRRFRWHFIFAPLISMSFCIAVLTYLNSKSYSLENFMYLYILLTLWDPWHFMRQHYGFMRIYDRVNAAPRGIAARMDLLLAASWFAFIMIASGDWMFDLLQDIYVRAQWPVMMLLTKEGLHSVTEMLRLLALTSSAVYLVYVVWCWKKNYMVSVAKILMCFTTFGVMYLTYTSNALIQSLAPGWSFKVGFAVIGIVHMTQYLAIVWRYNRSLVSRAGRARAGIFHWLHSRGAWWAAGLYVVVCLLYGDVITTVHNSAWLMSVLLAVGFTSTMMHYYFDGFIWKIRHAQNQEMLVTTQPSADIGAASSQSWWVSATTAPALRVLAKQLLYFAVPMAVLTIAAASTWSHGHDSYIAHMYHAQELNERGFGNEAEQEARTAFDLMKRQLPLETKLVELNPSAARRAELAFLIYNESLYQNIVMPALDGQSPTVEDLQRHHTATRTAIAEMNQAIASGGSLSHAERESFGTTDAQRIVASWQKQVG